MADVHAGLVKTLHPRRDNRGLTFRETTNQGDFKFVSGHAAERRLNFVFQLRGVGHARLLSKPNHSLQFI